MPALIDTQLQVETPENIDLHAECAGPVSRCLAYLIDLAIRSIALVTLGAIALFLGRTGMGIFLLAWFLVDWLYPVLFELAHNGQTPGKRVMGLRVVHLDLSPVGASASLVRNLLRSVDFLPAAYVLGLMAMCLTRQFQRLGDLAAGTVVIYSDQARVPTLLPTVSPQTPPLSLNEEERVALVNFARRDTYLSLSRKQELADILEPVLASHTEASVEFWQGVGLGQMGRG